MELPDTRCKRCNKTLTYLRKSGAERVCRGCGFIETIKVEDKSNG